MAVVAAVACGVPVTPSLAAAHALPMGVPAVAAASTTRATGIDPAATWREVSSADELRAAATDPTVTHVRLSADIDASELAPVKVALGGIWGDTINALFSFDHDIAIDLNGHAIDAGPFSTAGPSTGSIFAFVGAGSQQDAIEAVILDTAGGLNPSGDGSVGSLRRGHYDSTSAGAAISVIGKGGANPTLTIMGGLITESTSADSGCVYVKSAWVVMTGGEISGNGEEEPVATASPRSGSGVYVGSGGVFSLEGGEISSNIVHGDGFGGGVTVKFGTFSMSSGAIRGNVAASDGFAYRSFAGGIYGGTTAKMELSGGVIEGNAVASYAMGDSASAGGVFLNAGDTLTISGPVRVTGNLDYGDVTAGQQSNLVIDFGSSGASTVPVMVKTTTGAAGAQVGFSALGFLTSDRVIELASSDLTSLFVADIPGQEVLPDGSISVPQPPGATSVAASIADDDLVYGEEARIEVTVSAAEASGAKAPSGVVRAMVGADELARAELDADGSADLVVDTSGRRVPLGTGTEIAVEYVGAGEDFSPSETTVSLSLSPRELALVDVAAFDRVYNGTSDVQLDLTNARLEGVLPGDSGRVGYDVEAAWAVDGAGSPMADIGSHEVDVQVLVTGELAGWYQLSPSGVAVSAVTISPVAEGVGGYRVTVTSPEDALAGEAPQAQIAAVGVQGETVSGSLVWYHDEGLTRPLDDDFAFSASDVGRAVELWWRFVPESANYAPVTGSCAFQVKEASASIPWTPLTPAAPIAGPGTGQPAGSDGADDAGRSGNGGVLVATVDPLSVLVAASAGSGLCSLAVAIARCRHT